MMLLQEITLVLVAIVSLPLALLAGFLAWGWWPRREDRA